MSEIEKQKKKADVILSVKDDEGNEHYIFGDDFALMALTDSLDKLNELEFSEATKQ